jgi:hypothetical protein
VLVKKHARDRERYTQEKSNFVQKVLDEG